MQSETSVVRRALLVGSHFVPPAKVLLECLSEGTPVHLEREPENPFDPLAIKVWVESEEFNEDVLGEREEQLAGHGETPEGVLDAARWCLGHVGASEGQPLLKARLAGVKGLVGTKELQGPEALPLGVLEFSADGRHIMIKLEESET